MMQRQALTLTLLLLLNLCQPLTLAQADTAPPVATVDSNSETIDKQATALFDSIMSPYCPGVTLSSCASYKATDLRNQIREWLKSGLDEANIKSRLIESYGSTILGVPEGGAAGKIGWLVPILATVTGLVITTLTLRYLVNQPTTDSQSSTSQSFTVATTVDPALEKAVEDELERRRQLREQGHS